MDRKLPLCACGCGQPVNVPTEMVNGVRRPRMDRIGKYAKGHNKHWWTKQNPVLCACGCGQQTTWSARRGGWNEYVHGHHVRVSNPNKKGHPAWNEGNVTEYVVECAWCGKEFTSRNHAATYCSRKCSSEAHSGPNHHFWKGGKRTKYKFLRINGNLVKEHRHVMAQHLERKLRRKEVVHHIDEDGMNNKLSNLHLFHCEACHQHHHKWGVPLEYIYGDAH